MSKKHIIKCDYMKDILRFYYGINVEAINEIDEGYFFFYNDYKYYFLKHNKIEEEIKLLVKVSNELFENKVLVNTIILNNKGEYSVVYNDESYVLERVNTILDDNITMHDIVRFNKKLNLKEEFNGIRESWGSLWSKKIDETEMELMDFNKEFPLIEESINYYIGLSENAISYVENSINELSESKTVVNINHKRIDFNSNFIKFYDPLTFTFDYNVRDIAEYIKSSFFNNYDCFDELKNILESYKFNELSLRLLYGRVLYPNYYFDLYNKVVLEEEPESILNTIIDKSEQFEYFLFNLYNLLKKYCNLPPITWINDKRMKN